MSRDFDPALLNLFAVTKPLLPWRQTFVTWHYPRPVRAHDARHLTDRTEVLAVEAGGRARAYAVRTIQSRHLIQDRLGDREVLASF